MDEELLRHARSFGSVARSYERGRPPFPAEAAAWLAGTDPVTVLELGAGTGKLTEQLAALGHDVHATDPDPAMLDVLAEKLPDVRRSVAAAEDLPVPDRSVDVVVAAQSFHWFDPDVALPEIARVLRPSGRIAITWNSRDQRIPWVRRLGTVIGTQAHQGVTSAEALVLSGLFGFVEQATFSFWQEINRDSIQDLVLSRSNVASLDEEGRAAKLAEVLAFYDDYGRGMDGMQLPYDCQCYRAVVNERDDDRPPSEKEQATGQDATTDEPNDGTDTDMLLIDFR
jgi:ubiquinone/menaquinone biosynthesis C-methylase UbiE